MSFFSDIGSGLTNAFSGIGQGLSNVFSGGFGASPFDMTGGGMPGLFGSTGGGIDTPLGGLLGSSVDLGGIDPSSGETTAQVQSGDPGSQLADTSGGTQGAAGNVGEQGEQGAKGDMQPLGPQVPAAAQTSPGTQIGIPQQNTFVTGGPPTQPPVPTAAQMGAASQQLGSNLQAQYGGYPQVTPNQQVDARFGSMQQPTPSPTPDQMALAQSRLSAQMQPPGTGADVSTTGAGPAAQPPGPPTDITSPAQKAGGTEAPAAPDTTTPAPDTATTGATQNPFAGVPPALQGIMQQLARQFGIQIPGLTGGQQGGPLGQILQQLINQGLVRSGAVPLSSIPWSPGYNPQTGRWQPGYGPGRQPVPINPVTGHPYNPARAGDRMPGTPGPGETAGPAGATGPAGTAGAQPQPTVTNVRTHPVTPDLTKPAADVSGLGYPFKDQWPMLHEWRNPPAGRFGQFNPQQAARETQQFQTPQQEAASMGRTMSPPVMASDGQPASPNTPPGSVPSQIPTGNLVQDRAPYRQYLQANPQTYEKMLRLMYNEQGTNPQGLVGIAETMLNRASARRTPLEQQLRWHGMERGGYYQPGNMGRDRYGRDVLRNPAIRARLVNALNTALAGSNITNGATDNSSGSLARREQASGAFRFTSTYGGESFFTPGTAEPGLARRYDQWRQNVARAAAAPTLEAQAF
jgi:hypothetical protein